MAGTGTAHLRGDKALLRAEHLVVEFPAKGGKKVHAVSDVSLSVLPGETLGLVGESGCGKSTTGHALVRLTKPTSGHIWFEGEDLAAQNARTLRRTRARLQMIFQDPIASLNPFRKIIDIVIEPLRIWKIGDKAARARRGREILETVGLDPDVAGQRRASELSGGQCQRVSIARSVMLDPKLIICDEPVSALDVSVQASILNLLEDMKEQYGLSLIFIAHDLAVVKKVSDRVVVMYLGKICEVGTSEGLYEEPLHPYTANLLAAIPDADAPVAAISEQEAELPSPLDPPSGCRFRTRCPRAEQRCADEEPVITEHRPGHFAACHFPLVGNTADDDRAMQAAEV